MYEISILKQQQKVQLFHLLYIAQKPMRVLFILQNAGVQDFKTGFSIHTHAKKHTYKHL